MPNHVQHVLSAIASEWPKALIGSVVPIAQYGWKRWGERHVEAKKKILRERISSLAQFRASVPDGPDTCRIRSDADREYAAAVAKLAELTADDQPAPAAPVLRESAAIGPSTEASPKEQVNAVRARSLSRIRRWLLLYAPKRWFAWIPQTLYFAMLSVTVLGSIGILSEPKDPELWAGVLGMAVFFGITLLFRSWAVYANAEPREAGATPRRRRRWIPITIICVAAYAELCVLLVAASDEQDDFALSSLKENYVAVLIGAVIVGAIIVAAWSSLRHRPQGS